MLKLVRRFRKRGHRDTEVYVEVPTSQIKSRALAHVNHGRWLTLCPRWPDCGNATELQPQQGSWSCGECYAVALVEWPANPDELWAELVRRPDESTRNWYPDGHAWALAAGLPIGQSVADLRDEYEQHAGVD